MKSVYITSDTGHYSFRLGNSSPLLEVVISCLSEMAPEELSDSILLWNDQLQMFVHKLELHTTEVLKKYAQKPDWQQLEEKDIASLKSQLNRRNKEEHLLLQSINLRQMALEEISLRGKLYVFDITDLQEKDSVFLKFLQHYESISVSFDSSENIFIPQDGGFPVKINLQDIYRLNRQNFIIMNRQDETLILKPTFKTKNIIF